MSNATSLVAGAIPNAPTRFWPPAAEWSGGMVAAVVSLPQSMAYGLIAFAPLGAAMAPQGMLAGLYGALFIGLASLVLGGSQVLISGPRAASALVLSSLLAQVLASPSLGTGGNSQIALIYGFLAVALAGAIQVVLGWSRLGNLGKFVPYPVIAGFLNGSALAIILSQTGILWRMGQQDGDNPLPLLLGLATAGLTLALPLLSKRLPAPLVAVAAGSAAYHLLAQIPALAGRMGGTAGEMPMHLPLPELVGADAMAVLSLMGTDVLPLLLPAALSIAAISSLDTLLSTVAVDSTTLGRTRVRRELMAQGFGNMLAGLFMALPGSGSMARTAPALAAGARTRWSNGICLGLTALSAMLLPPVIAAIPSAVMSGVLLVVGLQLIDRWTVTLVTQAVARRGRVARATRDDLIVIAVVVAAALWWNLMVAVGVGSVLAAAIFIRGMARSLIRRSYSGTHVHARRYAGERITRVLEEHGHRICVLELEGVVFFGSADQLESAIERRVATGVTHFVLDLKRVKDIDSSGARVLNRIHQRLKRRGLFIAVSYVERERRRERGDFSGDDRRHHSGRRGMWLNLQHLGVVDALGEAAFWPDTDSALGACECDLLESIAPTSIPETPLFEGKPAILADLDALELRSLRPLFDKVTFAAGERIFEQGDAGDAVYFLSRGSADVLIDLPGTDRKKRVQTLLPGAVFGEMAVLDNRPRAAAVTATTATTCYLISKPHFDQLRLHHPDVAFKLMTNICKMFVDRLRTANAMIMELEI